MKKWLSLWLCIALIVPSVAFATQAPVVVPDGTGAAVRAGFNAAIMAVDTANEGASVPSPTYAGMFWADTGTSTLWQRNQGNTAWVKIGKLDTQNLGLIPAPSSPGLGQILYYDGTSWTLSPINPTQGSIFYCGASGWTFLPPGTAGQVLQTNGAYADPTWVNGSVIATPHGEQFFTSSGTFTVPAGVTQVWVDICGAGGNGSYAGGGAAAAYKSYSITGLTPGGSIAVTVGTSPGAASYFGAFIGAGGGGSASGTTPGSSGGPGGQPGMPYQSITGTIGSLGGSGLFGAGGWTGNINQGGNGAGYGSGGAGASNGSGGTGAPGMVYVRW